MSLVIKTSQPIIGERRSITHVIAEFWDNISQGWKEIWGPHIHHGYFEDGTNSTPLEAQEKLIEKLCEITGINSSAAILDAGCGMGGSSIYLARKFDARITGITLSKKQAEMARGEASRLGLRHVNFHVEDVLELQSISDKSQDVVWSLESCEQFYDKTLFIQQAMRVLKQGGKLMLATWCSDREVYEGEFAKKYRKLCCAFDLPYMPSMEEYKKLLIDNGFSLTRMEDWSLHVKKSWDLGITLANTWSFLRILKMSGLRGLRFRSQIKLMRDAYQENRVQYGVFIAQKI